MVVVVVPRVRAPLFPWVLRYASIHRSGWVIILRSPLTLLPLRATSEIALNLSPVLADSISMSLQLTGWGFQACPPSPRLRAFVHVAMAYTVADPGFPGC